ncbi:MAG: hypothetical protein JXB05_27640 [Myxococcaceae bacterium]|nr:hypothetical protein [Myxococcaceae bacterium]
MKCDRLDALALALLTACASTPRPPPANTDPHEAQVSALRYELRDLTSGATGTEPVEVEDEDFREAVGAALRHVPPPADPRQQAQWLMSQQMETHLLAEVRSGRVLRLTPLDENSPPGVPRRGRGQARVRSPVP